MRIMEHPILGELIEKRVVKIQVDGKLIDALDGEPIAAALIANGIKTLRYTKKKKEPRGIFCAIGQCSDCIMTVDGRPNVRTCVTQAKDGMKIETPNKEKQL